MSSVVRLSRFGKIAALSAVGGSFYFLRDEIKPYLGLETKEPITKPSTADLITNRLKPIDNLPQHVPYLLVGGGTASHSAMKAIRGHDPNARVLIITSENRNPYMRPALSKELWFSDKELRRNLSFKWWNGKERNIVYEIDEFFIPIGDLDKREHGGVSLIKNIRLTKLEPLSRTAYLENGQTIKYDKCLLAPGGKPKSLPVLDKASDEVKERIIYFRTADDFLKLDKITETAKSIAIIGGGFLGSELTCALAKRLNEDTNSMNQLIYQIYPEAGCLGKILPKFLSEWLSGRIEKEGAKLKPNCEVISVNMKPDKTVEMKLSNNETICAEYIVCAVGLEPDVELAKSSQLEVDHRTGGYLVNSELEARSNVWVAGDASCFYDIKLGRRRVEHHDHAINSGRLAGQNMTGAGKPYTHQSMFWSDIGPDISFEAVGIIDSSLPTVSVFTKEPLNEILAQDQKENESSMRVPDNKEIEDIKVDDDAERVIDKSTSSNVPVGSSIDQEDEKYGRGIVFYLKDDIVVGILLWNMFGRLTIARRILNEQKRYDDFNELAKLFNVYLDG